MTEHDNEPAWSEGYAVGYAHGVLDTLLACPPSPVLELEPDPFPPEDVT